jgi:hypothetical protein
MRKINAFQMGFSVSTNITGTEKHTSLHFISSRILPSSFCDFDLFNNLTQTGAYEFYTSYFE